MIEYARTLRELPFAEKLVRVKELAIGAMDNAYEQMVSEKRNSDLVINKHPLSHALERRAGCCRYQGALFFALGYEADLGNRHFIHAAPVNEKMNSVFNEVFEEGEKHVVSIFKESLKDKRLDYSVENPRVFEQAFDRLPGFDFYSYHRMLNGLVLVSNSGEHVKELPL